MTRRVRSRVGTQENWQILDDPVKSNSERGQETSHFRHLGHCVPGVVSLDFVRMLPSPGCRCAPSDGKWMPGPTATGEGRGRRPSCEPETDRVPRSLRGRNDRSEKVGNRGQIFSIWRCIVVLFAEKSGIWADSTARSRSISAAQAPRDSRHNGEERRQRDNRPEHHRRSSPKICGFWNLEPTSVLRGLLESQEIIAEPGERPKRGQSVSSVFLPGGPRRSHGSVPGDLPREGVREVFGEGISSAATARKVYGVVLDKDQSIDAGQTTALRMARIPGKGG